MRYISADYRPNAVVTSGLRALQNIAIQVQPEPKEEKPVKRYETKPENIGKSGRTYFISKPTLKEKTILDSSPAFQKTLNDYYNRLREYKAGVTEGPSINSVRQYAVNIAYEITGRNDKSLYV